MQKSGIWKKDLQKSLRQEIESWRKFKSGKINYRISSPITRATFSVFDTKVWEIFPQETGFGLQPGVWDSKTSKIGLKLSWQQGISDHQSDSLLPTHWKTISLNLAKLFTFHIKNKMFGLSAEKTTPSLSPLVRNTWEWNGPFLHVL